MINISNDICSFLAYYFLENQLLIFYLLSVILDIGVIFNSLKLWHLEITVHVDFYEIVIFLKIRLKSKSFGTEKVDSLFVKY